MASLAETEIRRRLGGEGVEVLGIEATAEVVRDQEQAIRLAERLGANVVLWGEAFALRIARKGSFCRIKNCPNAI